VAERFAWGVLGAGGIADAFVRDLALVPDARVAAVASRTRRSAAALASRHGIPTCHVSPAALLADPEIDAVYVATPHTEHHPLALAALAAGKAVLVEKPFTVDARQAREVATAATAAGCFLLEGMWMRFLPHIDRLRELLAANAIGPVHSVIADHSQRIPFVAGGRHFDPALGGGALLDLGVYPVSFAHLVLGAPSGTVVAASTPTRTGVDATTTAILTYVSGAQAVITTGLLARGTTRASVHGERGYIELDGDFYGPTTLRVVDSDGTVRDEFDGRVAGYGLRFEAVEVMECVRAGLHESPRLPLAETIAVMDTLDRIRTAIGLRYPSDDAGPGAG